MGYLDNACPDMVACVLTESFRERLAECVQLNFFFFQDSCFRIVKTKFSFVLLAAKRFDYEV